MGCFPTNKQISSITNSNMKQGYPKQMQITSTEMANSDRINNAKQDFTSYKTILSRRMTKVESRYSIVKKIGLSFNNVFRVTDNQTYKIYVLRRISKKKLSNDHLYLPYLNKLLQIKGDCIINVNDLFSDNINYYIVNDFVEGKRLFNYIYSLITYDELLLGNILYSVLETINFLHASSIHLPFITPKDIYYHPTAKNRELKVRLNVLNVHDDYNNKDEDLHQFIFIAPELLQCSPPYYVNDEKSSLWSLGVIFYCLFLGELPFMKKTKEELYQEIQTKTHLKNIESSSLSKSVKQLLKELLGVDKKQRITLRAALYLPFFEVLLQQHTKQNLIPDKVTRSFKEIHAKINFLFISIKHFFNLIEINHFLIQVDPILKALQDNKEKIFENVYITEEFKNLLGSSLMSMQTIRLKEETNEPNANFKIIFISMIIHWNKHNRKYLKRAFQLLNTVGPDKISKDELINILSYSNQPEIKEIQNAIETYCRNILSYEEYEALLFEQFSVLVKEGNYLSQYISDKHSENLYGNKWPFPDDSLDMEGVFEKNLSSSNISSESDEDKSKDKEKNNV